MMKLNAVPAHCRLYYFQYFLQQTLTLLLNLFTINTWVAIKKISIKQQFSECNYIEYKFHRTFKMGQVEKLSIKNQSYYFFDNIINIKNFQSNLLKIHKKRHEDFDVYIG